MNSCHECVFAEFITLDAGGYGDPIDLFESQDGCKFNLLERWHDKNGGFRCCSDVKNEILAYTLPAPCPYYRDKEWASNQEDVEESIKGETRLRFSLITILDHKYDIKEFVKNIQEINEDPDFISLQIIDLKGRLLCRKDWKEDFKNVQNWNVFFPLEEMGEKSLINMMVKRVKTTYYYYSNNGVVDKRLVGEANKMMFEELSPALYIKGTGSPRQYICQTLAHNVIGGNSSEWVYERLAKQVEQEKEEGEN